MGYFPSASVNDLSDYRIFGYMLKSAGKMSTLVKELLTMGPYVPCNFAVLWHDVATFKLHVFVLVLVLL